MQLNSWNGEAYCPKFPGLPEYFFFILKSVDKHQNALLPYRL